MIRVLLVDDQSLFRDGLRSVLTRYAEVEVVGDASNGEEALSLVERARPDVVLMDLQMPTMNGIVATRRLKQLRPEARVLVLTTFEEDEWVFEALRAGAQGYLLKDVSGARLYEAVVAASRGESVLQPSVASKVLGDWVRLKQQPSTHSASPFTERERDVVVQLIRGASNKEIAAALFVSEGTVKNHLTSIFSKLGVTDRTQAALLAVERGWA